MKPQEQVVYINVRFLTQPITGVQRFAIEICKALKRSEQPVNFIGPKNILHRELAEELDVKCIGPFTGHLWEQITLQAYVLQRRGLLVSLCNTAPIFIKKQIVTIHDLCFRKHPEWFSKIFSLVYNFIIPKIAKQARHVLTVSETSRSEISKEFKIPKEKISVIYNAVSSIFRQNNQEILQSLSKENYILTVSSHHPRKNFNRLIKAFERLEDKEMKLYIVGGFNKHFSKTYLHERKLNDRIILLENVSDKHLIQYYKHAKLFVFASLYEGFGIPIIEAMSLGTPVCVSDIPVFHEVCGNRAFYFNPLKIEDIKEKIETVLKFPHDKMEVNLSKFSWNAGAEKIMAVINKVV